jgi:hypothetical protein
LILACHAKGLKYRQIHSMAGHSKGPSDSHFSGVGSIITNYQDNNDPIDTLEKLKEVKILFLLLD